MLKKDSLLDVSNITVSLAELSIKETTYSNEAVDGEDGVDTDSKDQIKQEYQTGLVYDDEMVLHKNPNGPHLERPERIKTIFEELNRHGIVENCLRIPVKEATIDDLLTCHSKGYINKLMKLEKRANMDEMDSMNSTSLGAYGSASPYALSNGGSESHLDESTNSYQTPKLSRLASNSSVSSAGASETSATSKVKSPKLRSPKLKSPKLGRRRSGSNRNSRRHSLSHANIDDLDRKKFPPLNDRQLNDIAQEEFDSVFLNRHSFRCARLAAGGTLQAIDSIAKGEINNALAIVRPPGHHAESHCAMGFCVFNNVALAAKRLVQKHHYERVLIVDWDVHHGNGTQRIFFSDPKVLYFSVHRYNNGCFYPLGEGGAPNKVGIGEGKGKNVNVALNGTGFGDFDYAEIWKRVLLPIAKEFEPQIIIVSAGFDAAEGDPLGEFCITPKGYGNLLSLLYPIVNGKLLLVLEGGYNLASISSSVVECANVILNHTKTKDDDSNDQNQSSTLTSMSSITPGKIKPETYHAIQQTLKEQAKFWKCFATPPHTNHLVNVKYHVEAPSTAVALE